LMRSSSAMTSVRSRRVGIYNNGILLPLELISR